MKFSPATRELIKFRAQMRCELCGARVGEGGQIHHRQPRGMGGSSDEQKGSCSNGLWVHLKCHEGVEKFRMRATTMGWLVPQGMNPSEVPVKLWDAWWLLADDGTMSKVDSP